LQWPEREGHSRHAHIGLRNYAGDFLSTYRPPTGFASSVKGGFNPGRKNNPLTTYALKTPQEIQPVFPVLHVMKKSVANRPVEGDIGKRQIKNIRAAEFRCVFLLFMDKQHIFRAVK
jgi:hypothetical protein